jgi:predicted HicB family RNase H-like nuclease
MMKKQITDWVVLGARIPRELHRDLKVKAARQGTTVQVIVEKALKKEVRA